jgi:hypothetical protein
MRFNPQVVALALSAALPVACSEQPSAPLQQTPAVAADFINNPDNGNPRILRSQQDLAVSWTDPSNGLRATHWTYNAIDGCGDTPPGAVDWQQVATLDTIDFYASRFIENAKGRVWIRIRDTTKPGDCFGNLLVAQGWGTIHYLDSDQIGNWPPDQTYVDAYGFEADGVLTTPDGGQVNYRGYWHGVFDSDAGTGRDHFQVRLY